MALLDKVKAALRISHTALDDALSDDIEAAKAELIRAGCDATVVGDAESYPLVVKAIKTYCLAENTEDESDAEGYRDSFKYQQDCLRRSSGYRSEDEE